MQTELIIEGRLSSTPEVQPDPPSSPSLQLLSPQARKKMKPKKKKKKQEKPLNPSDLYFDRTPSSCPTSPTAPRKAHKPNEVQEERRSRGYPVIRGDLGLCLPQVGNVSEVLIFSGKRKSWADDEASSRNRRICYMS
jgi:hypothetical protein